MHAPPLPKYDPSNKESMFFDSEQDYLEFQKLNNKQLTIKKKMVKKAKAKFAGYKISLPEDEPMSSSDSEVY